MSDDPKKSGAANKTGGVVYSSFEPDFVPAGYNAMEMSRTASSQKERRRHRRIAARGKAAVICSGRQEIVEMLNVSRGGVYIRTSAHYSMGTYIQIAVHFVEGGNNIFAPARIARVHLAPTPALPGEYGVEILRSAISL